MTQYYLCTPKADLPRFKHQSDRDYFARPVLVEPLYCNVADRLTYVVDRNRGHIYPIDKNRLRSFAFLTPKQRKLVGGAV